VSFSDSAEYLKIEGTDLGNFYTELKNIKDHHRRQPLNSMAVDSVEIDSILERTRISQSNLSSMFTGEERSGRFLDLYALYDEGVNLCGEGETFDYLTFLQIFDRPVDCFPASKRATLAYSVYLDNLIGYLKDFITRTRPISDLSSFIEGNEEMKSLCDRHRSQIDELVEDSMKSVSDELFCAACDKLFTNPAVFSAHLTGKRHLKASASTDSNESSCAKTPIEEARNKLCDQRVQELKKRHEVELKEHLIGLYGSFLKDVKISTKGNVERKQALTAEERIVADEDSEFEDEESVNDEAGNGAANNDDMGDGGKIYNPLKLPLDWDGKPIPFWLWKLHGLGVPFSCEVCGNFVYMGRRAFDQHFYEWRHNHGMKCLGVPNTSHFFQVTQIEDVKRLWEKMRQTAKTEALRADWMEECEDSSGNVYDRRTFEDLKRQGLI
jgi:splicing factor 3A subunit 3